MSQKKVRPSRELVRSEELGVFSHPSPLKFSIIYSGKNHEIGGRNGGLSLYYAVHGSEVLCSDITENFSDKAAIHQFLHRHFHGYKWHYFTEGEILNLFAEKFSLEKKYFSGLLGCFGFNEKLRELLGVVDSKIFSHVVPARWKYVGIFIFKKV